MTYQEAKQEFSKRVPKGRTHILNFIEKLKDQDLVDKLCAKWFAMEARAISFIEPPHPPPEWIEYKASREYKTEAHRTLWNTYSVQEFVRLKRLTEASNHSNFMRMKEAITLLDESEEKAKKELQEKLELFIKNLDTQKEPVFELYDFNPKRPLFAYN